LSPITVIAAAQTIVPVDARFPPPDGFAFQGSWKCEDNSGGGTLRVGKPGHRMRWHAGALASTWTEVTETAQNLVGRYFVAYARDKQQFIMIDADNPAYAVYSTDGWRDHELTLTAEETQLMPKHRLVYKVDDPHQFTVILRSGTATAGHGVHRNMSQGWGAVKAGGGLAILSALP
jgi:hypothetical protein